MRTTVIVILFFLFCIDNGIAQESKGEVDLYVGVAKTVYVGSFGNGLIDFNQEFNSAFSVGLSYDLIKDYEISLLYTSGDLSYSSQYSEGRKESFRSKFTFLRFKGKLRLNNDLILPRDQKIQLFLTNSLGTIKNVSYSGERVSHLSFGLGFGLETKLCKTTRASYHFGYNWTFLDDLENSISIGKAVNDKLLLHEIGLSYNLPISEDFDKDGVLDHLDDCPKIYANSKSGCPDSDEDGIIDKFDECPLVFGPMALNGCPDTDSDGILDKNDHCPKQFGPEGNKGCPTNDKDSDGVLDKEDRCPDIAGRKSLLGCPDTDGDGIADIDDTCPQLKGVSKTNGCPDKDNDGVRDSDDECPSIKGTPKLNGCPGVDTDGDGIEDKEDYCPNLKGTRSGHGCPDKDRDGIIDKEDNCPNVSGNRKNQGCPDTDGDGIIDKDDRCPNEYGVLSQKGCPDDGFMHTPELEDAGRNIDFVYRTLTLKSIAYDGLAQVKTYMRKNPTSIIMIIGYSTDFEDAELNTVKSLERTGKVRDYLVSQGISKTRFITLGMAESREKTMSKGESRINFKVKFN